MSIVGIVAEYNPLHGGHLYHIEESRRITQADAVICVMSGNFAQRGEPAIVDKWARAEMALRAGADLVFEIPVAFAARSAYFFALGSVLMLQKTGVVTHISFGSELGDIRPLQDLASVLAKEPPALQSLLKQRLKQGLSYPAARSQALLDYMSDSPVAKDHDLKSLLSSPNNILAMEYLRIICQEQCTLIPATVHRKGSGYYEPGNTEFPSATYIRTQIAAGTPVEQLIGLPPATRQILSREFAKGSGPVNQAQLTELALFMLKRLSPNELAQIYDVTEGLENIFKKAGATSSSLDELFEKIKSKRYNRTRLNRILLYVLINLTKQICEDFDSSGPLYLRLLGFSPCGQKILQDMKTKSELPVITKTGSLRSPRYSDPKLKSMLAFDVLATDLYSILTGRCISGLDYSQAPVSI
ncbi:MAG: nucleotidyltransferase [Candidatus Saccharibacteria bacterium]